MPLWEKRRSALVLAGLTVFHVLLISIQVPRGAEKSLFERAVFFVFSPVQRVATGTVRGIGSLWNGYFDLRGVRRENQKLKRENFFLNQDVRFLEDRLQLTESEAELRASLAEFEGSLVAARVIGVDSANPHQSIVIDKGSFDGVGQEHGRLRPERRARRPDDRAGRPEGGDGPAHHRQGQQRQRQVRRRRPDRAR